MSRSAIRAAVKAFLDPPNVAGVNTVYAALPTLIPEQAFFAASEFGGTSGAVIGIYVAKEPPEVRVAVGGATDGLKRIDYELELHVFFRYVAGAQVVTADPTASDPAVLAEAALDTVVDAIKARIRSDRTAGSSAVWQWGEDLAGEYSEPALNGGIVELWCALSTTVTEFIHS